MIKFTKNVLSECPTDRYLIVTQPGVNAADLDSRDCALPHFCKAVDDSRVNGKYTVAEVIGDVTNAQLDEYIKLSCNKKGKAASVDSVRLGSLAPANRAFDLSRNGKPELSTGPLKIRVYVSDENTDVSLTAQLEAITSGDSYTILFYATPREPLYEPDFIEPVHMDMKRDSDNTPLPHKSNGTEFDKLPLFEKYQFFTPGRLLRGLGHPIHSPTDQWY